MNIRNVINKFKSTIEREPAYSASANDCIKEGNNTSSDPSYLNTTSQTSNSTTQTDSPVKAPEDPAPTNLYSLEESVSASFNRGSNLYDAGMYQEAYQILAPLTTTEKVNLLNDNKKFDLYIMLGMISKRNQNFQVALDWYNRLFEIPFNDIVMIKNAYIAYSKTLYLANNPRKASNFIFAGCEESYHYLKGSYDTVTILIELENMLYHFAAMQMEDENFIFEYKKSLMGQPANINNQIREKLSHMGLEYFIQYLGLKG